MIDGILWFPFNLIAKNSNYKNALEAANGRILRLTELEKERSCQNLVTTNHEVIYYK